MNEGKDIKLTGISKASTEEEIAEFWDSHSLADYWEQTREVEIEVRAKHRRRITLEPEIYERDQPLGSGKTPRLTVNRGHYLF